MKLSAKIYLSQIVQAAKKYDIVFTGDYINIKLES
jgi:hypothetical protein